MHCDLHLMADSSCNQNGANQGSEINACDAVVWTPVLLKWVTNSDQSKKSEGLLCLIPNDQLLPRSAICQCERPCVMRVPQQMLFCRDMLIHVGGSG